MNSKKPGGEKWKTWPKRAPKPPDMTHLSDMERGYIAGMIDGEGSILLRIYDWSLAIRLHVYNTNMAVLEWLKTRLGGYISSTFPGSERRKPCYRWSTTTLGARAVLRAVAPAMIIKRRHAQLIDQFFAVLPAYKKAHPGRFTPSNIHEPVKDIVAELNRLNRRGPRPDLDPSP